MATAPLQGSIKAKDERYSIKGRGLFIFATPNEFRYNTFGSQPFELTAHSSKTQETSTRPKTKGGMAAEDQTDCGSTDTRNDEDSVDGIGKRFRQIAFNRSNDVKMTKNKPNAAVRETITENLKRVFGLGKNADNVIHLGEDEGMGMRMTPENTSGDNMPFEGLINHIRIRLGSIKPSFLMFVLASAGEKHGEFFLSSKDLNSCFHKGCERTCRFKGHCQRRRISDLIRAIQEAEGSAGGLFFGVPKVFLIQTVSGRRRAERMTKDVVDAVPPGGQPDPDDYIPKGSDTLVFYVHTEETVQWINTNGFYLLDQFCDAIEKLSEKGNDGNELLRKIVALYSKEGCDTENLSEGAASVIVREFDITLNIQEESLSGAWFDNFCTTVAANIANFLGQNKKHLNAHMSSTLRYRLSVLDVLRSEH